MLPTLFSPSSQVFKRTLAAACLRNVVGVRQFEDYARSNREVPKMGEDRLESFCDVVEFLPQSTDVISRHFLSSKNNEYVVQEDVCI